MWRKKKLRLSHITYLIIIKSDMARRASQNSSSPILIIGCISLILIIAIAITLMGKQKEPFENLASFPMQQAMKNANSLRGNSYKVRGKVEERWVKNTYEGLHLSIEEQGQTYPLFIKLAMGGDRPNIEREQTYTFSVRVEEGGIPVVTAFSNQ